jgi:hypothetical protein
MSRQKYFTGSAFAFSSSQAAVRCPIPQLSLAAISSLYVPEVLCLQAELTGPPMMSEAWSIAMRTLQ